MRRYFIRVSADRAGREAEGGGRDKPAPWDSASNMAPSTV